MKGPEIFRVTKRFNCIGIWIKSLFIKLKLAFSAFQMNNNQEKTVSNLGKMKLEKLASLLHHPVKNKPQPSSISFISNFNKYNYNLTQKRDYLYAKTRITPPSTNYERFVQTKIQVFGKIILDGINNIASELWAVRMC